MACSVTGYIRFKLFPICSGKVGGEENFLLMDLTTLKQAGH
jgi:hypothetical protein